MKKSDLKYGNVVETREGIKYLYHCKNSDKFLNLDYDGFLWIRNFDENLNIIDCDNGLDIMKVYEDYTCKELLWERKEKPKLTEDEKVILRNLPKKYKWIARDSSGMVYIYTQRPTKLSCIWSGNSFGGIVIPFDHLFQFIEWEDDEPYLIEELLGEEK